MARLPHIPLLALTVASVAAPVAVNTFVGFDDQTAGAGEDALGIADYDAETGTAVAVTVMGTQRVIAGGVFNKGDEIEVGAGGKAVALNAGKKVAKALEDSAGDGVFVTVLLTP
ncbi:DUF2190 family protein [Erythrobacter sp. LQ02-29]|uniref:capsid cement protein n=1 Tax=Erythrobacter sp. LQ02-29 TaxID=2920384 RepID=UPI001F4DCF21|nr:capsid cement protein [Erythrobacter sp. LQ02-29]MCP9222746.1 DUF2190 family protein [Erythrobacter sp. LQ02-29]